MSELEKIRDKIVALECPANESHIAFALGFGECRAMVLAVIGEGESDCLDEHGEPLPPAQNAGGEKLPKISESLQYPLDAAE